MKSRIPEEFFKAMPKTDLHLHLDGSLRLSTLIELAQKDGIELPAYTVEEMREKVFKDQYNDLPEYLEGFKYTCAVMQKADNIRRIAYELAQDCFGENVRYFEVRFAPQLLCNETLDISGVLRATNEGLKKAKDVFNQDPRIVDGEDPPFEYGIIVTAMRSCNASMSKYYGELYRCLKYTPDATMESVASLEAARAAVYARDNEGIPIVGFDIAGAENGYPAERHTQAFDYCGRNFLCKTVHAGEAYGPESIYQAITRCNAVRIGHGFHLFSPEHVTSPDVDPESFVKKLVEYVAEQRVTIEVCLTSNQDTMPELRTQPLSAHSCGLMLQHNLSIAICTDNRTVSNTTSSKEFQKCADAFNLAPEELRLIVVNGFKRAFFPGFNYRRKRAYVRQVIDMYDRLEQQYGVRRVLSNSFPGYERTMSLSDGEALRQFLREQEHAQGGSKDSLRQV